MTSMQSPEYTEADATSYCKLLRVPETFVPLFMRVLQSAAQIWHSETNCPSETSKPTDQDKMFHDLADILGGAKLALENLDQRYWEELQRGNEMTNMQFLMARCGLPNGEVALIDKPAAVSIAEPEGETAIAMDDLIKALGSITNSAQNATTPRRKSKTGPQPNTPLLNWVEEMHWLCTQALELRFTCYAPKGEPVSDAACFCVAAYHILSPNTPKSAVLNAMKKEISRQE